MTLAPEDPSGQSRFPSLGNASAASGGGSGQRSFFSAGGNLPAIHLNFPEAVANANLTLGTGTVRFSGSGVFPIRLTWDDLKDLRGQFKLRYVDSNQQGQKILKPEINNLLLHKALVQLEDTVVERLVSNFETIKETFFSKMDTKHLKSEEDIQAVIRGKLVPLLKYPKAKISGPNGEEEVSVGEIEDPVLRNQTKMSLSPILPAVIMDGGRSKIQVVHPVTGAPLRDVTEMEEMEKMIGWDVASCTVLICGVYLQKKGNIGFITRAKEMAFLEREDPF
jgi:hypothetical protein